MFDSVDHDMKVHMKEKFRQFVYSETTSMVPPPNKVACKGAPKGWSKQPSYSQEERSTKRQLSQSEHAEANAEWADKLLSQPSQSRRKSSRQCNVAPDGHCGFCAAAGVIDKKEEDFQLVRLDLSIELRARKKRYIELYGGVERYNQIEHALARIKSVRHFRTSG
ncbi:hypothetical protein A2U01_0023884 [Trifolium medium]|uniref:Uncharacterized protein n=1 Tax=Trifolium medium TaxID=97028 RepID=A0A392NUF8_9FABA|nr:hypothetical protein [Trifolium medium]